MHYYYLICPEIPEVSLNPTTYIFQLKTTKWQLGHVATSFPSHLHSHVFHCILISCRCLRSIYSTEEFFEM